MIQSALQDTAGIIAVSQALKEKLIALGALPERIAVLRNGVDLSIFKPLDRAVARCKLGLSRPTLLSVGNLLESKGHGKVIQSLLELTEFDLVVVGEGPHRPQFELLASRLGVSSRVRFLGSRRHCKLP